MVGKYTVRPMDPMGKWSLSYAQRKPTESNHPRLQDRFYALERFGKFQEILEPGGVHGFTRGGWQISQKIW